MSRVKSRKIWISALIVLVLAAGAAVLIATSGPSQAELAQQAAAQAVEAGEAAAEETAELAEEAKVLADECKSLVEDALAAATRVDAQWSGSGLSLSDLQDGIEDLAVEFDSIIFAGAEICEEHVGEPLQEAVEGYQWAEDFWDRHLFDNNLKAKLQPIMHTPQKALGQASQGLDDMYGGSAEAAIDEPSAEEESS